MYCLTMARKAATLQEKAFGAAVGTLISRARQHQELSGQDLARLADVSIDTIRSLESGRVASPGLFAVSRLSNALGLTLGYVASEALRVSSAGREAAETTDRSNPAERGRT